MLNYFAVFSYCCSRIAQVLEGVKEHQSDIKVRYFEEKRRSLELVFIMFFQLLNSVSVPGATMKVHCKNPSSL